ncbi:MAG: SUMF1/EgtB/PvdO family nonheme iron enzyme [Spirosomataceae bacterium]
MKPTLWILCLGWCLGTALAQEKTIGTAQLTTGTERRMALIIGMDKYQHANPLKNPSNDVDSMVVALQKLGFKKENISVIKNKGLGYVQAEIDEFIDNLQPNDLVFFYFSGHGIGYKGDNYLLPIDARIQCLNEIPKFGFSVNTLQVSFRSRQVRNNFLILDACRSLNQKIYNCKSTTKNAVSTKGFVFPQDQLEGDAIAYATQNGEDAQDNPNGKNSLFTQELLKFIVLPDLNFYQILTKTTQNVLAESRRQVKLGQIENEQLPSMYGNLGLDYVFIKTDDTYRQQQEKLRRDEERQKAEEAQRLQQAKDAEIAILKAKIEEFEKKNTTAQPDNTRVTPSKRTNDLPPFVTMVPVQGGTFKRGDYDITVSSFSMGKHEVTVGQYLQFCKETNGHWPEWKEKGSNYNIETGKNDLYKKMGKALTSPEHPIVGVSWHDAVAFCDWLGKKEGKVYRLPTEAEWEYAAGGGSGGRTVWAGTDTESAVNKYGNVDGKADGYEYTSPVGIFTANRLGLHDLSGNVWEWCSDWYGDYPKQSETNPKGAATGSPRVLRGGSWGDTPHYARVALRDYTPPVNRIYGVGFRVVSPSQL